jgi:hypothetical protein
MIDAVINVLLALAVCFGVFFVVVSAKFVINPLALAHDRWPRRSRYRPLA